MTLDTPSPVLDAPDVALADAPASSSAAEAALGTSSHHNEVTLNSSAITDVRYIDGSFAISSGQPSQVPPTITRNGSTWTVDAYCGRHKTESVAAGFNGLTGGSAHLLGLLAISDTQPAELNFYFGLVVDVRVGNDTFSLTLYTGQGSTGARNNWWLGGGSLVHHGSNVLVPVVGPEGETRQVFAVSGSDANNFALTPWF